LGAPKIWGPRRAPSAPISKLATATSMLMILQLLQSLKIYSIC